MYRLIPQLIHDQTAVGQSQGSLAASTLFLDIAGFTAMTELLMQRGKEGAERMAAIINKVFAPVIELIYQHDGFITSFAGDAFTAVFPGELATTTPIATAAAVQIRHHFRDNSQPDSVFGEFRLAVKQGLAAGRVEWGVIGLPEHKSFYFRGDAIRNCRQAETRAGPNEIILDASTHSWLPDTATGPLATNPEAGRRLLPDDDGGTVHRQRPLASPSPTPAIARQFFPLPLWDLPYVGELRPVTPVFIAIPRQLNHEAINQFVRLVLTTMQPFGGHFVETYFGNQDGLILLYFGAPVASEDNVARALQFCLALQKATADTTVTWRAGMTTGTVYAGYIGIPLRAKYTALGSVVNQAARLQQEAARGQVLVNEQVAAHPNFQFAYLGQLPLKGFAQPAATYALQAGQSAITGFFSEPLVGRQAELAQLKKLTQPLQAGITIIYGEAGMGKSHLAHAWHQYLDQKETPPAWFVAQTDPVLPESFAPFIYWLKNYFEQSESATATANRQKLEKQIGRLLATPTIADNPSLQQKLQRGTSFLGALLGLYWADSLYLQSEAHLRYQQTLEAIQAVLLAESQRQPVVLLLEDFHWLDEASRELLTSLAQTIATAPATYPILLLATARYDDGGQQPMLLPGVDLPRHIIDLNQLSLSALQQQAEAILQGPVTPDLVQWLYDKSAANPFFAQQILHYCQENNLLKRQAGMWWLDANSFDIPDTIQAVLMTRLDRLARDVKIIVQTAAVLGREFEVSILAGILQADVTHAIQQAEQEQIWSAVAEYQRYMFRHVLLRDAAYDMQLRTRLRELHRLAAIVYEEHYGSSKANIHAPRIATHYEQAGIVDKMAYWFSQAGQQALERYANEDALAYFTRALETDALTPADKLTLYNDLGEVLRRQGLYNEAILVYQSMLETAVPVNDKIARAKAWIGLSWAYQTQGQDQASLDSANRAEAILRPLSQPSLLAETLYHKGWALYRLGQINEAHQLAEEGLILTASANLPVRQIQHLNLLSVLEYYSMDAYETAVGHQQQALALAQQTGDRHSEGFLTNNLGDNYMLQGNYAQAHDYFQQALTITEEIGDQDGAMAAQSNRATALVFLGDYETAVGQLIHLIRTAPENWYVLPDACTALARAYLGQGQLPNAINMLHQAWEVAAGDEQKGELWLLAAQLTAQTGQIIAPPARGLLIHDARDCFNVSLKLFAAANRQRDCARVWQEWARFEWQRSHPVRGDQLWQLAREKFTNLNLPLLVAAMDQEKPPQSGRV